MLYQCVMEDEKERYRRIATKFYEKGGGGGLEYNDTIIEEKLVEFGLEEFYVPPGKSIRPRKRLITKSKGGQGKKKRSHMDIAEDTCEPLPAEMYDELMTQIESRNRSRSDVDPTSAEMDIIEPEIPHEQEMLGASPMLKMEGGGPNPHHQHPHQHQHSERVARQACEELIRSSQVPAEERLYHNATGR